MSTAAPDRCECGRILAESARADRCENCRRSRRDDQTTKVSGLTTDTSARFRSLRYEAQDRMDYEYLDNDEFVNLLLDVYEYHLEAGDN